MVEEINKLYRKMMLRTGFLKSTIGTSLISIGFGTIILSTYDRSLPDHTILIGILAVTFGFIIYYAGDIYNINKNKDLEDLRLKRASQIVDDKISQERDRLAEEVLEDYEKRKAQLKAETNQRLEEIRVGVCNDIQNISNGDELSYCSKHVGNPHLERIRYPDSVSPEEILRIGIEKMGNKNIKKADLLAYCDDLYESGLITQNKRSECIEVIFGSPTGDINGRRSGVDRSDQI